MLKSTLRTIFIFLPFLINAQEIKHLEPSSWWIGMKNPKLQILVHGEKISDFSAKFPKTSIKLLKMVMFEINVAISYL
jgi:neopullulanase